MEPPPAGPEEPPPERELWPWLLVLLLLVLAGLAAAWYASRDSGATSSGPRTEVTTVAAAAPKKPPTTQTAVVQVAVPDVVGQQRDDAVGTLEAAGLRASVNEVPSTQDVGIVVAQSPHGGEKADKGAYVNVNVSKGKPEPAQPVTVTVPSVVGQSQGSATAAVERAGLRPSIQHVPSTQEKGIVVSQSPSGGSSAQKGARVLLNVSHGPVKTKDKPKEKKKENDQPAAVTVPSVVGETEASATADIQAAGLSVSTVDQQTDDPTQDGIVVDQSLSGGTDADRDTTVTIYVARFSVP